MLAEKEVRVTKRYWASPSFIGEWSYCFEITNFDPF
jgi:hypothetical protein